MNNSKKITLGIILTILVYSISILISRVVKIPTGFIPPMFLTPLIIGVLASSLIYYFHSKGQLVFKIKKIKLGLFFKAILISIVAFIIIGIIINGAYLILDIPIEEKANPFSNYSPNQFLVFIVILASIAEELLFRGFLLNILVSLKDKTVSLFKLKISISILISGVLFGLAHLILLTTDAGLPFVMRIVIITTIFGIIAGYLQEKHESNTLLAIIVHMTVNTIGLTALVLTMN